MAKEGTARDIMTASVIMATEDILLAELIKIILASNKLFYNLKGEGYQP